jgi:GAF domain-containing protein
VVDPVQANDEQGEWFQVTRQELDRQSALVRLAHQVASEPTAEGVLAACLEQAVTVIGGDGGVVYRWDEGRDRLILVRASTGVIARYAELQSGEGATGQAVARGGAVILNDYAHARQALPDRVADGVRAVLAVPIFHSGRLLGALTLFSRATSMQFTFEDAETLELLASMVAATLVGLERAQLSVMTITARELAHQVNNALALVVGTLDLLSLQMELPAPLVEMVHSSHARIDEVVEQLRQLQQLARFETKSSPVGPVLDMDRSLGGSTRPDARLARPAPGGRGDPRSRR